MPMPASERRSVPVIAARIDLFQRSIQPWPDNLAPHPRRQDPPRPGRSSPHLNAPPPVGSSPPAGPSSSEQLAQLRPRAASLAPAASEPQPPRASSEGFFNDAILASALRQEIRAGYRMGSGHPSAKRVIYVLHPHRSHPHGQWPFRRQLLSARLAKTSLSRSASRPNLLSATQQGRRQRHGDLRLLGRGAPQSASPSMSSSTTFSTPST